MLIVRIMEADYIGYNDCIGLDVMLIVRMMEADYIGCDADC